MAEEQWCTGGELKDICKCHEDTTHFKFVSTDYIVPIPRCMTKFTKAISLDLQWNDIREIRNLDTLVNLEKLNLNYNNIKKINGLENLKNLNHLDLRGNDIKRIEGLENLDKLNFLAIDVDNRYSPLDVEGKFDHMKGLEELHLHTKAGGVLRSPVSFPRLEKLKRLNLKTYAMKIEGLENFPNLEELKIEGQYTDKMEGFESLTKLKKLDMHTIQNTHLIKKIEGIKDLENLESLILWKSKIKQIPSLRKLKKLEKLHLHKSFLLNDIQHLDKFIAMQDLLISVRKIKEEDLDVLFSLQDLEKVEFQAMMNPFPKKIIDGLPKLKEVTFYPVRDIAGKIPITKPPTIIMNSEETLTNNPLRSKIYDRSGKVVLREKWFSENKSSGILS